MSVAPLELPALWLLAPELDGADELDGEDELWLVAPPEACDFFVVSVEEDELDEEGVLLLGVAAEELDEPDGGVALPPTEAEPEAEPEGELGVVDADDEELSRCADGELLELDEDARSGPRSQAARPRAIATAIARVESLMSPPWLETNKRSSSLRAGSVTYGFAGDERFGALPGCEDCDWSAVLPAEEDLFWSGPRLQAASEKIRDRAAAIAANFM